MMPKIPLKAIVLVHFVLTVWGTQAYIGGASWISPSYAYMNFFVLAIGIWAVADKESIDSILMFLVLTLVTILLDMILIGIYYSHGYDIFSAGEGKNLGEFRFSAGMAILNLLVKPFTCILLYHQYRERGGDYNVGLPGSHPAGSGYENIDQPIPSNSQVEAAHPHSSIHDVSKPPLPE